MGCINASTELSKQDPGHGPTPFLLVYSGSTIDAINDCASTAKQTARSTSIFRDAISTCVVLTDVMDTAAETSPGAGSFAKDPAVTDFCMDVLACACVYADQHDGDAERAADRRDANTGEHSNTEDGTKIVVPNCRSVALPCELDKVHPKQPLKNR